MAASPRASLDSSAAPPSQGAHPLAHSAAAADPSHGAAHEEEEDDWEEWDGTSPFWVHCAAGSMAGLTEHALVFPLDTIRTNLQVACSLCAQEQRRLGASKLMSNSKMMSATATSTSPLSLLLNVSKSGATPQSSLQVVSMWSTIRNLMSEPLTLPATAVSPTETVPAGSTTSNTTHLSATSTAWIRFARLWRGVQTMLVGCVPAHALYFSSYEAVKSLTSSRNQNSLYTTTTWWGASLAGAAAVTGHDLIMTPLDTIKQRLQLGHYQASATRALTSIVATEGIRHGLYKSLGVTLVTNVPYGMILVATQESIKGHLHAYRIQQQVQDHSSSLCIKDWQMVLLASSMAGFVASAVTTPLDRIKTCLQTQHHVPTCWKGPLTSDCPKKSRFLSLPRHGTVWDAGRFIYQHEGWMGFYRGLVPRVLSHTPAAAISWTTYETAKMYLLQAADVAALK